MALVGQASSKEVAIFQLRRARIEGYKALSSVEIQLPEKLLFLIGTNGAGKSSTLQALAFIQFFAADDPLNFFHERGWRPADIRARSSKHNTLRYSLTLEHTDGRAVVWQFIWGLNSQAVLIERMWLSEPDTSPRRLFNFTRQGGFTSETGAEIRGFLPKGSLLGSLEPNTLSHSPQTTKEVVDWAMGITSLELLSPVAMRSNTRGSTQGIGVKGQRLAGFLAALDAKTKDKIVSRLADFYPLDNLSTTRKRAGWVDLKISESYQIGAIGAAHASDGFLRLLALCAIPEFGHKSSLVLLDEIEDGIEPHILPRLIERVVADSKSQFIMTSHSPLLINFFPPEEVMLVTRSDSGESRLKELSNLEVIRAGGEYLGSGEVWANTGLSILNQQALSDLPDEDPENMFEYEWPSRELQRP